MNFFILLIILEFSVGFALIEYHCRNEPDTTDYQEHDLYSDGIRLGTNTSIKFQVKGSHDAHILLQKDRHDEQNNVIEVVIGGWGNSKSVIRTQKQQDPPRTDHLENGLITPSNYRWFWISWSGRCIQVGKGDYIGSKLFMKWCGISFKITAIRISFGFGSDGYFAFECIKSIEHCSSRHCKTAYDTICDRCINNKVFYKVTQGGKKCERMCSFDNHKCWPGQCPNELTTSCQCNPGFTRVSNSTSTVCQLATQNRPTINSCFTTIKGPNSEKSQTKPGKCRSVESIYGNFQPVGLDVDMQADFTVNISVPKPPFIHISTFGVTDASIHTERKCVNGTGIEIENMTLLKDVSYGTKAKQTVHNKTQILLKQPKYKLENGERLCVHYETLGGGFVQGFDTRTNKPLVNIPYLKTKSTMAVCYIYDNAPPQHCLEKKACDKSPLHVDNRITKFKHVQVYFDGWFDPLPNGGSQSSSSGLDRLELSMHEVSDGSISGTSVFTQIINASQTSLSLNVPSATPRLYCLKLEVKDKAANVKFARRFILYDNTSCIKTRANKTMFYVSSASKQTHYLWQTHHNQICVMWKDYFFNDFYLSNPLLNGVQTNPDYADIYEQTEGLLPVSGTSNVNGIIQFLFSWKVNNGTFSNETIVPSLTQQLLCSNLSVTDGQTYTLSIRATDIINNSFAEERTVFIDRSVPLISNIWIRKDDRERLFVHGNSDLSKMKLSFETFDPHSGIYSIEWNFGTENSGHLLGKGTIKVNRLKGDNCPDNETDCYCPDIGSCEKKKYTVDLNKLVNNNTHIGDHNRNYFLTLTVFNHARLRNVEHLDILVDVSPPETGVVYEGSFGTPDIDYTNENDFIVRWHGFIDHESGIKMYKVGVSDKCLSKEDFMLPDEILHSSEYYEVNYPETSVRVQANFTGKKYVTVIAINNALQSSEPACSDGITRVIDAPALGNISLQNAKWSPSIYCVNDKAWFFNSELLKMPLFSDTVCKARCSNISTDNEMYEILPVLNSSKTERDLSEFLCQNLPFYNRKTVIYLPNDHISIKWNVEEDKGQIKDFLIGIGKSPGKRSSPEVRMFQSTRGNLHYYINHLGLGSNEEFFIFIKAINKANLESIISFGPLLIDETPPLYRQMPVISIHSKTVQISWEDGHFYDTEQTEKIDQVVFQFVQGSTVVSPLLEWRYTDSEQCPNVTGGCISYPLERLQQKDTELGVDFSVDIYIYNKAGHFAKLRTDPFKIPSRYPPGQGIVLDIDPSTISSSTDINAHFVENKVCVRWKGFRHHENVSLRIGVGNDNTHDNILPFKPVDDTETFTCLSSEKLVYGVRYFVIIRASCTGGSTISSSDGVLIIDKKTLLKQSDVKVGAKKATVELDSEPIDSFKVRLCFKTHGRIGANYKVSVKGDTSPIWLQSNNSLVRVSSIFLNNSTEKAFDIIPYVEQPCFILNGSDVNKVNVSFTEMPQQGYVTARNVFPVSLRKNINITHMLPKWALFEYSCNTTNKTSQSCAHKLVEYQSKNADFYYRFTDINLNEAKNYTVGVQLCTPFSCSEFIFSNTFSFEHAITPGYFTVFDMLLENNNSASVNISWKGFEAKSGISLYQWVFSKDDNAEQVVGSWTTITYKGQIKLSVTETVYLPVDPRSMLYFCVRAFSNAGNRETVCRRLSVVSKGIQDHQTVYDLDASSKTWNRLLDMIHSSNLGNQGVVLHDSELDFGTIQTKVAGAMLYSTQRNITWYLMATKSIPHFDDCQKDSDCIISRSNTDGYILFDNTNLVPNKLYFICAFAEEIEILRESNTETFTRIKSCSDGFIIDTIAPSGGQIFVENTTGYLNNIFEICISWERFIDNANVEMFGYSDSIKYYSYTIGTSTTSTDIRNFTNVGLSRRVTERINDIRDGTSLFVSVQGTDQAGLSTVVHSKKLVVDTSPPSSGQIEISNKQSIEKFITSDFIDLHFADFFDAESGINHFEICLESHPKTCDITNTRSYYDDTIQLELPNSLLEGTVYGLSGRAVNRAGLKSEISTNQFIKDTSPPTGGLVMDGLWSQKSDEDYQTEIDVISGHWMGFSDPHSGVEYYRVGLGSHPGDSDVEPMLNVHLKTDISWNGTFVLGQKYFITVEACNSAGLCTSRTSDGLLLDNSPPISGIVNIGPGSSHLKYIPHRTSLHIQWTGFEDSHSEIEHYEYCVGRHPYACDVCPLSSSLLQSNVIKTNISLPIGINLYVMVIAFNWAGLSVNQTSDSFQVDDSPPQLMSVPRFVSDNNIELKDSVYWDKSLLRVTWNFTDEESQVIQHVILLKSHHEGHTPAENVVIGNVDMFVFNLDENNWLHDGDTYFVRVTSCNTAGLCSSAESRKLLIDSSPPHMGGFMPPMSWINFFDFQNNSKANVSLLWYGFVEPESSIDRFYVTVSRTFSGDELTDGCAVIDAKESKDTMKEQSIDVTLNDSLTPGSSIILTVWAQNAAGLNSTASKVTVFPLLYKTDEKRNQSGSLELKKHSCDSHFCGGECTCSVIGKSCTMYDCNFINDTTIVAMNLTRINVYHGFGNMTQTVTASSACLSGHWNTVGGDDSLVLRYKWSIGIVGEKPGTGIFDHSVKQWQDVGKRTNLIYCLPPKSGLLHAVQYQLYVKAWYSNTDFAIFNSSAIVVDQTPPQIVKGMTVLDSDYKCDVDYDIIDWMDEVTFCWNGVFRETQSIISHYIVSLGTSINGSDVMQISNVGKVTNMTLSNLNLTHGTKYSFTVIAYNSLGMQTMLSSDGFVIDMDTPVAGVVYNTPRFINKGFQSSTSEFGLSWHGFVDNFSGVKSYHVTFCEENITEISNLTFVNVGFKTRHIFSNVALQHGRNYIGLIKAYDAAGHSSTVSRSASKRIDVSPPHGLRCDKYILKQRNETSIESSQNGNGSSYNSLEFLLQLKTDNLYKLSGILFGHDSLSKILIGFGRFEVMLPTARSHNGSQEFEYTFISPVTTDVIRLTIITVKGEEVVLHLDMYECNQNIPTLAVEDFIKIQQIGPSTLSIHALVFDPESSIYKMQFGLGTTKHGLQIKSLFPASYGTPNMIDFQAVHGSKVFLTVIAENHAGLSSTFTNNTINIDKTPPSMHSLQVSLTEDNRSGEVYDIFANWIAEDIESDIKLCFCRVGEDMRIEKLKPVTSNQSCEFRNIRFQNGDRFVVKVVCVNKVELSRELVSDPLTVSRNPPNTENAEVNIISSDRFIRSFTFNGMNMTNCYIQSDTSQVKLEWFGFEDRFDIDHYEYRLRHASEIILDWKDARKRTMSYINGLSLTSGELYAIDVRAESFGNHVSDPVTSTLLIYSGEPKLTGKPMLVSQIHQSLSMDWIEVFDIQDFEDIVFDVTVGSRRGYSDVIEYQRVKFKHCVIPIPEATTVSDKINEVFVVVTCMSSTGQSAQYETNYKM